MKTCFQTLMVAYTFVLLFGVFYSIHLLKKERYHPAFWVSLTPNLTAAAIVLVYIFGGIQLR